MSTSTSRAPVVTAVLVAHDGATWLPEVLTGLAGQTRRPEVVVGVDVASSDNSRALLVRALGAGQVCVAGRDSSFGAAVQAGLDHARPPATGAVADNEQQAGTEPATRNEWVWLLHDDSCPAADALRHLLEQAVAEPVPGVVGPKVRGWNDQRLLLEVGVTIARSGRRETGLERREHDQGQHDGRHRVLATGSAGMLVRRDVWDQLGGFDRALPLFRDDVDFGWRANLAGHRVYCVTDAVVHHAEAASHGRRRLTADVDRHHLVDRRNAIFVLLANLPLYRLPLSVPRLAAGSLLRSIGLLAGKLPGPALDELRAFAAVVVRPDRVVRARVARRRTRELPARAVNPLLAARWSGLRHLAETVAGLVGTRSPDAYGAGRHRVVESGPTSDEAEDLPGWGGGLVRRAMVRPAVLLVAVLTVLTVVAWRALLGGGLLFGGALLPAGGGAPDLWHTYTEGWHPVGLGSDAVAPPYLAVLAALATLLFGSVGTAVTVVLMGAVPLAALSAYLAARPVLPPRSIRLWAAAAYALLPAVVGAAPAGRLGTAVVAVVLPPAVWSAARALGGPSRPGSTSVAFLAGLLLAVLTAFAPVCYLMALALGLAATAARVRLPRRRDLLRLLPVLGLAPLLLAPWLPAIWDEPDLLLREPGLAGPGLVDARLSALDVLLVHPGGPGMYPLLVTVPLLLAALAALLRRRDKAVVWAGWAAALVGMAAAVLVSRSRFTAPPAVGPVSGWPGPATLVAGAGLVLASAAGAVGARSRIAAMSFGWRQPSAVVLTVVSALVPVVAGAWWAVAGADRPLHRGDSAVLPAFVAAEAVRGGRPRTLVLRSEGSGRLAYSLLRAQEPAIGQADTVTNGGPSTGLSRAVSDLASGRGGDAAGELLPYGVRYVLMPRPVDAALAAAVDAVPGLLPVSAPDGSRIWTLAFRSGRLRLLGPTAADPLARLRQSRLVPGGVVGADARIPPGPPGRVLLVSESSSSGWRAQLDGRSLAPGRYDGWAQTFRVPPAGGHLVLGFDDTGHQRLLWFQLGAVLLAVVLALPRARRDDDHDPLEGRSS